MDRRQKALLKRILSVFVPLVILLLVSVIGTSAYFAYKITHPEKRAVRVSPEGYQQILRKPDWSNAQWPGSNGVTLNGWVFYQKAPSPTIVLSHRYGANREELIGLAYRIWEAGFNIVAYDLRGHGENPSDTSSFGPAELDDLMKTIEFAKQVKNPQGEVVADGRIGLYGVELGGFISLSAAAMNEDVAAVVADSIYPSQEEFQSYLTRNLVGNSDPSSSSVVDFGIFQSLISTETSLMTSGGTHPLTAREALARIDTRPVLVIVSKTSSLSSLTKRAITNAPNVQILEFDQTRSDSPLYVTDAMSYDKQVVDFFLQVPALEPAEKAAEGQPAAPAEQPAAPAGS